MGMEKIEHVVLFMLENRSLDSLLGWLYEEGQPALTIPPTPPGERAFDGLQGLDLSLFTNVADGIATAPRRGASGLTVPSIDPGETFEHVNVQLFGKSPVGPRDTPTMKGYLQDYLGVLKGFSDYNPDVFGPMIMESYTPAQLPVLNGLAAHYAVCDRWFCSVPSQTNPNRAFSLCGTSMGLVDNGYLESDPRRVKVEGLLGDKIGDDRFDAPTIWNALYAGGFEAPSDWKIFWQSAIIPEKIHDHLDLLEIAVGSDGAAYLGELSSGQLDSCYVHRLFPRLKDIPGVDDHFAKVDEFHRLARAGKLPRFSYIEPRWNIQETAVSEDLKETVEVLFTQTGNDYHPPGNVAVGEEFLREVYLSLIANPAAWDKTLLIVTTDEAVGQFDHVLPPPAIPPWGDRTPQKGRDLQIDAQYGFNCDRYGARVPTLLVSPYIQKGTVFRAAGPQPYDHTSLIATVLRWLGLGDDLGTFGERTKTAPTFEGVLTLEQPRTDARDIGFLVEDRKPGDRVRYYDRFLLQGNSGKCISTAAYRDKTIVIDPVKEYFPTMGSGVLLHFEKRLERDSTDAVANGDLVKIITLDAEVGAYNVLGNWADAEDCYYYNDYLIGEDADKQTWVIQRADGGSPIRFGDTVTLVSRYEGETLAEDGTSVAANRATGPTWTLLVPPRSADGSAA